MESYQPDRSGDGNADASGVNWELLLSRVYHEARSHLPGDEVLQFLDLLQVLRVFLHVLLGEEGLGEKMTG